MESNDKIADEKIYIDAREIIKQFRNKQDREYFCIEKNWWNPKEVGFGAEFFMKVLLGEKRYLPNNFAIHYKFSFFRKGETLDKSYLIAKMKGNSNYSLYTPDHINPMRYSKNFLINLIAYVDPKLFHELYTVHKARIIEKTFNLWSNYKVGIQSSLINDIRNFSSINNNKKERGGFKRTIAGRNTGIFTKNENIKNIKQKINMNRNIESTSIINSINSTEMDIEKLIKKETDNQLLNTKNNP